MALKEREDMTRLEELQRKYGEVVFNIKIMNGMVAKLEQEIAKEMEKKDGNPESTTKSIS